MNNLNLLYKSVIEALGGVIGDDYSISIINMGNKYDVKVAEKKVYLPVNEVLNTNTGDKVFFHPACESIVSKETEIDKVIRKMMTVSIYRTFQVIPEVIFKIANKRNKLQSNKLQELLEPLKGLSNEVRQEVINLIARISITTEVQGVDTRVVHFSINRGGKSAGGDHIYYKCTPSFPYYTELNRLINQNSHLKDNDFIIFADNKVSIKAAKAIISFFEITIPSVTDTSRLTAEVTTQVAARFISMLRCFSYIASEINELIGKFRKEFDSAGVYGYNLDFLDKLEDIGDIYNMVLPLEYNNYNTATDDVQPQVTQIPSDLFSFTTLNNQPQTQQPASGSIPQQPPMKPGETFSGFTLLPNGLYEFRFQSGNMIRVVCVTDQGNVVIENFIPVGQQAIQQPMVQPQYQQTQPYVVGNGYYTLPNGIIVPINTPPGTQQVGTSGWGQPQQQPVQTGWGTTTQTNFNGIPSGGFQ